MFQANMLKKYSERSPEVQATCVSSIIDFEEDCLSNEEDFQPMESIAPVSRNHNINSSLSQIQVEEMTKVIHDHKSVFSKKPGLAEIEVHKIILTSDQPIASKAYPVPFHLRETQRKELKEMEEYGIIRKSNSSYASPMVIARKKDSSLRLCPDYRKLNKVTIFDPEPMPDATNLIQQMGKAKYYRTQNWTYAKVIQNE